MSFKGLTTMLLLFIYLLLNPRLCSAATPSIYWPELLEDPQYKDLLETGEMIYKEAFEDAITLARIVVLAGSDCDPVR